jgi:hypothetical protein
MNRRAEAPARADRAARLWTWTLLLAGCAAGAGCCCPLHSVHPVPEDLAEACACIADSSHGHVYVFFMQGTDLFDWANLQGINEYVQSLGFRHTWFGFFHHVPHYKKEILRLHQEDPEARFVLVGFSLGANLMRDLACAVAEDGVCIDVLMYVDAKFINDEPHARPGNVCKLINFLAKGYLFKSGDLEGAENLYLPEGWHFATPTHPGVLEVLARELARLAGSIPAVDDVPTLPFPRTEPTPRPVTTVKTNEEPDEWDFLKPVSVERQQPLPTMVQPPTWSSRSVQDQRRVGR